MANILDHHELTPKVTTLKSVGEYFEFLDEPFTSVRYKVAMDTIKAEAKRQDQNEFILPYPPNIIDMPRRLYTNGERIAKIIMEMPRFRFIIGHPLIQPVEYHLGLKTVTPRVDLADKSNSVQLWGLYDNSDFRNLVTDSAIELMWQRYLQTGRSRVIRERIESVDDESYFNKRIILKLKRYNIGPELFVGPQNNVRKGRNRLRELEDFGLVFPDNGNGNSRGVGSTGFLEFFPYLSPSYDPDAIKTTFTNLAEEINISFDWNVLKRKGVPERYLQKHFGLTEEIWEELLDYRRKVQAKFTVLWKYIKDDLNLTFLASIIRSK